MSENQAVFVVVSNYEICPCEFFFVILHWFFKVEKRVLLSTIKFFFMKKTCVLFLTMLLCMSVLAIGLPTRGLIVLKPGRPTLPIPGTTPRTEPIALFSAFQTPDEIIITSEAISTTVTVNIYNAAGVVVETVTETVAAGNEFSVDITNLPAGAYILEIAFDDTVYVGQFEL